MKPRRKERRIKKKNRRKEKEKIGKNWGEKDGKPLR